MATLYEDFKLDVANGDIDIGDNQFSVVTTNQVSLQQRLLMRFSVWQGNWEFDLDLGFPYRSYIGNKVIKAIIDAKIKETVRIEDDVRAIENFTSTLVNSSRSYSAYFDVITAEDETVSLAFISNDQYIYPEGTGGLGSLCDTSGTIQYGNKLYYLINFRMPVTGDSTWINTWS